METIVTIRRLVLELGVDGDTDVKTRLEDINKIANSTKQTLVELNKEISILGSVQGTKISGAGALRQLPLTAQTLTSSERAIYQEELSKTKKEYSEQKIMDQRKIEIAEKQIQSTDRLLQAIDKQIEEQQKFLNKQFKDISSDQQSFERATDDLKGILRSSMDLIDKTIKPVTKGQQLLDPVTKKFLSKDESSLVKSAIQPIKEFMNDIKDVTEELDLLQQSMKLETDPDKIKSIWNRFDQIRKTVSGGFKHEEGLSDLPVTKLPKKDDPDVPIIRAYRPALEEVKHTQSIISSITNESSEIDNIEAEINRLKNEGNKTREQDETDKIIAEQRIKRIADFEDITKLLAKRASTAISQPTSKIGAQVSKTQKELEEEYKTDTSTLAQEILAQAGLEKEESVEDPQIRRQTILESIRNERERNSIKKEIGKIRDNINKQLDEEEIIKKRGFVFKPAEKVKEFVEQGKERFENIKETVRDKAVGFISKLPLFESSEDYFKKKEDESGKRAEELVKSKESQQLINNYNIKFENTVVDTNKREQDLIEKLTHVLRGL